MAVNQWLAAGAGQPHEPLDTARSAGSDRVLLTGTTMRRDTLQTWLSIGPFIRVVARLMVVSWLMTSVGAPGAADGLHAAMGNAGLSTAVASAADRIAAPLAPEAIDWRTRAADPAETEPSDIESLMVNIKRIVAPSFLPFGAAFSAATIIRSPGVPLYLTHQSLRC